MDEAQATSWARWAIGGLATLVMTIAGWWQNKQSQRMAQQEAACARQDARISRLEKESVTADDLDRTITRVESKLEEVRKESREDIRDMREHVESKLDRILERSLK